MPISTRSSIVQPWTPREWPIVTSSPMSRRMRVRHHVDDRPVLDVGARADADPVHVAADDDVHPDAALRADLDVADDLGAVVDEGGRMDAGHVSPVGAEAFSDNYSWRRRRWQVQQATALPSHGRALSCCSRLRRGSSGSARPERQQMVADRADLRLGVAAELRVERLRIVGPERRHARAGQDVRRLLQPGENPVRLQPLVRHPQVGREVRRRLILRNRAEHMALLALQQLEQLPCRCRRRRGADHRLVRLERPDRCSRSRRSSGSRRSDSDRRGRRSASGRSATAGW